MKLKELYSKPIGRAVNPAVSATKFDPDMCSRMKSSMGYTESSMPSRTTSPTTMWVFGLTVIMALVSPIS